MKGVYISEQHEYHHTRSVTKSLDEVGKKVEHTSVWLKYNSDNDIKIFYCFHCRYPILQYKADVVTILPGDDPSPMPIICQCKGKHCGHKYFFHLMVY